MMSRRRTVEGMRTTTSGEGEGRSTGVASGNGNVSLRGDYNAGRRHEHASAARDGVWRTVGGLHADCFWE